MSLGTVTITGVGLMGGSLGLALKSHGLARRVIGLGRDTEHLEVALTRHAIDEATVDPAHAYANSELAVICTPVSRIVEDVTLAFTHGPDSMVVTDVGSTKSRIVQDLERNGVGEGRFVGAHPVVGSERSGVHHARANLYVNAPCVLTRTPTTRLDAYHKVKQFWQSVGCRTWFLDPAAHDLALARVSHLPHAIAAALVRSVTRDDSRLAGGAYRDGTRVAASDGHLWTDIFLDNRDATLDAIDSFSDQLSQFRALLAAGDRTALLDWWREARLQRHEWNWNAPREQTTDESDTDQCLLQEGDLT